MLVKKTTIMVMRIMVNNTIIVVWLVGVVN